MIFKLHLSAFRQVLYEKKCIYKSRIYVINALSGMAYCGVIGHARKTYAIVGPPINKAVHIMDISYNKVIKQMIDHCIVKKRGLFFYLNYYRDTFV